MPPVAMVWSMYYSSLICMAMHPGGRKGCEPFQLSDYALQENAKIADRMLGLFLDRFTTSFKEAN